MLRTVIGDADAKGTAVFLHFSKPTKDKLKPNAKNVDLNKIMQNVGGEQFDYGTFKAAYDTDARVKTMTKNFNQDGVEPKTAKELEGGEGNQADTDKDDNTVSNMAKSATDLGDKL